MFLIITIACTHLYSKQAMGFQTTGDIRKTLVTVSFNNLPLKEAFAVIEQKTGLSIGYNSNQIDPRRKVSIDAKNLAVATVLQQLLAGYKIVLTQPDATHVLIRPQESAALPAAGVKRANGGIRGRIVEFETSAPIPGATVLLEGASRGAVSDAAGYYRLTEVPAGKHVLLVSMIGFQKERVPGVDVREGKETVTDIRLKGSVLAEVVISSSRTRTKTPVAYSSIKDLVTEIRASRMVVSGISSEQISKTGDRNAAEALKRVSGLTIKDEKFVIVRGMDTRYNLTYLNDNVAPSTELYTRDFSLDLVPSRIIDRVLVYKSANPEMLADMTGGAVKIYTKDAKLVRHFDIEVQAGYRANSAFKDMLSYKGGQYDFMGFDDGARKLPAIVPGYGDFTKTNISQEAYAKNFSPVLQYGKRTALPNLQVTANYFDYFRLGKRRVSWLTSFSYKHEDQVNDIFRAQGVGNPGIGTPDDRIFYDQQGIENAQLSLLQNFTFPLRDSGSIQFKNFLLNQGQKSTIISQSQPSEWTPELLETGMFKPFYKNITLSYSQRFLYAGNLGGKHYFGGAKRNQLQWNAGYTYSNQTIPDQRLIRLQQETSRLSNYPAPAFNREVEWRARVRSFTENASSDPFYGIMSRVWIRNKESVYNGMADYSRLLAPWLTLRAGTFHQWKERNVFRRVYLVQEGDVRGSGGNDQLIGPGGYGDYIDPYIVFFGEQDLGKVWSTEYLRDNTSGLKVFDRTNGGDTYEATEQQNTGYLAASLTPLQNKLDIYAGLRVEYSRQKLAGAIFHSQEHITVPVFIDNRKTHFLPSVNITYRPISKLSLRGAYGRTVNRPEFREIAPYRDIDYINGISITGNPYVVMADIQNVDARLEFYPNDEGDVLSAGIFYKHLNHPIERIRTDTRVGSGLPAISFQNAGRAEVKGLEIELRKTLNVLPGKFFRNFSIMGNLTLINSQVVKDSNDVKKDPTAIAGISDTIRRQLQGQAPYIINAGVYYDNAASGTKVTLVYNVAGTRIYAAGPSFLRSAQFPGSLYRGSLFELPRHLLDFTVSQRVFRSLQIKATIQNLLNEPIRMAEDFDGNFKYTKGGWDSEGNITGDTKALNFNPGRYYVLNFIYSF
ncbi:TonB-dependent receptor [Chitinophaga barathri]|nr:TonB-dependent receptor [Chitinophaga barathri]